MPWVRFTKIFNYVVTPAVSYRYPAGWSGNVKTECADEAVAEGKAVRIKTPRKGEAVSDGDQSQDAGA